MILKVCPGNLCKLRSFCYPKLVYGPSSCGQKRVLYIRFKTYNRERDRVWIEREQKSLEDEQLEKERKDNEAREKQQEYPQK